MIDYFAKKQKKVAMAIRLKEQLRRGRYFQSMAAKILLVDDVPEQLMAYRRLLHRRFQILTADSGDRALAILQREPGIDVIVSDMSMPGMSGTDFFVRAAEMAPTATRIMLTGNTDMNATIDAINRGGVFRYLQKPCARDDLIEAVEEGLLIRPAAATGSTDEECSLETPVASWLQDALHDCLLNTFFQPIVDLKTGQIHHYEVLSRLTNGKSPFDLVCFAEQVGLIADFDLMVCRRVVAMLDDRRRWRKPTPLAINLSARSMESRAFAEGLMTLLAKFPSMRGQIMFELTESAAITDPEPVANLIEKLRKRTYKVCLDDFGSGAAAFHYLRSFSFDYVKVDGLYVRSTGRRDQSILRGMAALCKELGVVSVAEMVESKTQADRLQRLGFDLGQGYHFGRPSPDLPDTAPN